MNNSAILIKINSIKKHPNADNLQIVNLFGTQVITDMSVKQGDVMIYFDSNLQLSDEYCKENNLYRHSELNIDKTKVGYFEENRRIKAIKLRGEFSDGMLMPLSSLVFIKNTYSQLTLEEDHFHTNFGIFDIGDEFTTIGTVKVCEKYIPIIKNYTGGNKKNSGRKTPKSPMFVEHIDTGQFFKNQHIIPANTICYIMEKTHGTSGRIANVLIEKKLNLFQKILLFLLKEKTLYEYKYIHGSRRVTLFDKKINNSFHDNTMREEIFEKVKGLLDKGQEIYFEIYGYDKTGTEIQKGFTYGCKSKEYKVKLYRVTMNNEDGKVVDYSLDYVIRKAEELGLNAPYLFDRFYYDGSEESMKKLENKVIEYAQGQSIEDPNTMREGVVIQFINNKGNWDYLKYKSDAFRLKESGNKDKGIIDQEDIN
jgi:tRNA-binding EMAP/Myf-like protein